MQLGMIGLGRMGANMVKRLIRGGHQCVVFDKDSEQVQRLVLEGAVGAGSMDELIRCLTPPRIVWVMVPSGDPTEATVEALAQRLSSKDIVIDGGNSYFKDDVRRAKALAVKGLHYVDVGTSGGTWGLERGYCLMIGGPQPVVAHLDPIFKTLAPGRGDIQRTKGRDGMKGTAEDGYLYCGPAGAGHFVKMVHNGIEYGLMQAYAEGFDIFRHANSKQLPEEIRYDLNLPDIAEVWRRGSVVGSWLLDLTATAMADNPDLSNFTGSVQDSGEGRWTVMAAVEEGVPAEVLSASLYTRFRSRQDHTFAEKVLSAMRYQFGGHVEKPAERECAGQR
ncbi:MAG: decarboxylating 6-phosphogluconate dehydrogenase [Nitrospira sp.]|jgi:6-phosphogluconate dehydrogenase